MADETVKQGTEQTAGGQEQNAGRTFTQAELDAILGDRLARERAKYADYETIKAKADQFDAAEAASKSELEKAQDRANQYKAELDALKKANATRAARDKVAAETGVPAELLTEADEESCRAQANALLKWHGPAQSAPGVPDGGEATHHGGAGSTADQFAEWFGNALRQT